MKVGRQKEFDETLALEEAMHVFWQKGYAGASLSDLTQAMGINKPSLYATFGNKESLFVQAAQHYITTYASPMLSHLNDDTKNISSRLKNFIHAIIHNLYHAKHPVGCFVSRNMGECNSQLLPPSAEDIIIEARDFSFNAIKSLLQKNKHKNASHVATVVTAFIHGSATLARSGHSEKELRQAADALLEKLL